MNIESSAAKCQNIPTYYSHAVYTSKFKILRIKNREYRDGIKNRETRPGWGEAHNVACSGTTEGF